MRKLFAILLILATATAACVDDGVCATDEDTTCADCNLGDTVCEDDGVCTLAESKGTCYDCRTFVAPAATCESDGVCTDDERAIGTCSDCVGLDTTGMFLIIGGVSIFGFFGVIVLVLIIGGFLFMKKRGGGRSFQRRRGL